MHYCPKCGGEIRGAVNFCPYCGATQYNQNTPSMKYSYQAQQSEEAPIISRTEQNNVHSVQHCSKCGGEIKAVANFCSYCGAEQTNQNMSSKNSINQAQQIQEQQSDSNNKLGLGYLLALIFSISFQPVGFIISLVGYFTAKNSGNHTNKTLAKAGIIVSILEFISFIILCIFFFQVFTELMKQYPPNAY